MKYNFLKKLFDDYQITKACFDSRAVELGDAFFAIQGYNLDGNEFIPEACKRGARLIFTDDQVVHDNFDQNNFPKCKIVHVDNGQEALAHAAGIIYPKLPQNIVAVTGTNGKTSVVSYYQQLIELLGAESASIGTLGISSSVESCNVSQALHTMTTPNAIDLRKNMHNLANHSINYVALEASSHGITQRRFAGINFAAIAFTSFSQDHLDYHGNMQEYFDVKLQLCNYVKPDAYAIINYNIADVEQIKAKWNAHNIKVINIGKGLDVNLCKVESSIDGQEVSFAYMNRDYNFHTKIIGSFQIINLLTAALLVEKSSDFSFDQVIKYLPQMLPVDGRLQRITDDHSLFHIFIDYAHNVDSLEHALQELCNIVSGRLIVLFGCGGNRDIGKRPLMAAVASSLADYVIVTDDNFRTEDPADIRQDILKGIQGEHFIEIAGRRNAINFAIDSLKKGDTLIIAGKGHEIYQEIGHQKIHFNDAEVVNSILKARV